MFQTNTLFKTNKCHHGGPPWSGGPGAIAPVAPPVNPALRVLYQKNMWVFTFEMHLISGITDEPPPDKLNVKTGPLRSLYFGSCYSFGFCRLLFFVFFGVFSGDFGFLYSCSIPGLLLFLNYFLNVGQWTPFS